MFSVSVPITSAPKKTVRAAALPVTTLQGVKVLCIDNEQSILAGMNDLLNAWKCEVFTAQSAEQAIKLFEKYDNQFDFLLVDYQLQDETNDTSYRLDQNTIYQRDGICLIQHLQKISRYPIPAILITATTDEDIISRTAQADIGYLRKVIKPIALRALMSSLLAKNLERNYAHQDFS